MVIDTSPKFFRRLVKFYLFLPLFLIVVTVLEFSVGPWSEFSDAFDKLSADSFEPAISEDSWLIGGGVLLAVHYIGGVGLIWFKHWSRIFFIAPIILFGLFDIIAFGAPDYSSPLISFIMFIDSALFGAIFLLCYSKNHGHIWFARSNAIGDV